MRFFLDPPHNPPTIQIFKNLPSLKLDKSYSEEELPKIIHIGWFGSNIPAHYIPNIHQIYNQAKAAGVELHLWVDSKESYLRTIDKLDLYPFPIKFRFLHELDEKIDKDYTEEGKKLFYYHTSMERIGSKNLAALADFNRFEMLRQHGGIWDDIDCPSIQGKMLTERKLRKAQLAGIQARLFQTKAQENEEFMEKIKKLPEEKRAEKWSQVKQAWHGLLYADNINAMIVCDKDHPVLYHTLAGMLNKQESLKTRTSKEGIQFFKEQKITFRPKKGLTHLDYKRLRGHPKRKDVSVDIGLGPFQDAVHKFTEANKTTAKHMHLTFRRDSNDIERAAGWVYLLPFLNGVNLKCDKNWLTPKSKYAFETPRNMPF